MEWSVKKTVCMLHTQDVKLVHAWRFKLKSKSVHPRLKHVHANTAITYHVWCFIIYAWLVCILNHPKIHEHEFRIYSRTRQERSTCKQDRSSCEQKINSTRYDKNRFYKRSAVCEKWSFSIQMQLLWKLKLFLNFLKFFKNFNFWKSYFNF